MGFSIASWVCILVFTAAAYARTVTFHLELTWEKYSPDGHEREMILVNGQFPGPRLEMNQEDDVHVLLTNLMPFDSSIHFHGIEQLHTMWSDGTPGVTQRPVKAGEQFLYKWTATEYGSYWYHSHSRDQINDGLFGPILIHPSEKQEYPFANISPDAADLEGIITAFQNSKTMMVGDFTHELSRDVIKVAAESGVDLICPDVILINGKGEVTCPTPEELADPGVVMGGVLGNQTLTNKGCLPPNNALGQGDYPHDYTKLPDTYFNTCTDTDGSHEVVNVENGQAWISFDWICNGGIDALALSIDEHPQWVYAVDGRFIEPYKVDSVVIDPGARYSVMVPLKGGAGRSYTIRVYCKGLNQFLRGEATLKYPGTADSTPSEPSIDRFGNLISAEDTIEFDPIKAAALEPISPGTNVNQTYIMEVGRWGASYQWTVNGKARYPDLDWAEDLQPILFNKSVATPNVSITTYYDTWVDFVLKAYPVNPPHPLHKHSNRVFVIGSGQGEFNYSNVADAIAAMPDSFNLKNPLMRDTWAPPAAAAGPTWTAVRYHVVNPGATFLHCHIQIHLSGGMALVILDGIDAWPTVPDEYLYGNGM